MGDGTPGAGQLEPRLLTDDEVATFQREGWVRVPGFLTADAAATLLARLQRYVGGDAREARHPDAARGHGHEARWNIFCPLSVELVGGTIIDEVFYGVSHSTAVGNLGRRLIGRRVRYLVDESLVKMPAEVQGSDETAWHCDQGARDESPFDHRQGTIQIWVALTAATPERGTMRFVAPRHLDDGVRKAVEGISVLDSYEVLEASGILSPPLVLAAGDATIHGAGTFHSAPPNRTGEPRWAYTITLFPAEARYTGRPHWAVDGTEGLRVGAPFPDHRFRVVAG